LFLGWLSVRRGGEASVNEHPPLSFKIASKRCRWKLMTTFAAFEVRAAAVWFVDPAGAAAAGEAAATGHLTLSLR
jgi:hypothetical protein